MTLFFVVLASCGLFFYYMVLLVYGENYEIFFQNIFVF